MTTYQWLVYVRSTPATIWYVTERPPTRRYVGLVRRTWEKSFNEHNRWYWSKNVFFAVAKVLPDARLAKRWVEATCME